MRWFEKDSRIYIGPVSDVQMDLLRSRPTLANSGIACQAAQGRVEVYLTMPRSLVTIKALEDIRMETV